MVFPRPGAQLKASKASLHEIDQITNDWTVTVEQLNMACMSFASTLTHSHAQTVTQRYPQLCTFRQTAASNLHLKRLNTTEASPYANLESGEM